MGFNAQIRRFDSFMAQQPVKGKLDFVGASRHTFSSTSRKWNPCMSVGLSTVGGTPTWLTAPVGTSSGKNEPSSLTEKGGLQITEKKVFDKYLAPKLLGQFVNPIEIDRIIERVNDDLPARADGIETPLSKVGGPNATALSLVAVLTAAKAAGVSNEVAIHWLYNKLALENNLPHATRMSLPIPMSKIVDGGAHGAKDKKNNPVTPIQEFLFIPFNDRWTGALESTMEATGRFLRLMEKQGFRMDIGAEAGIVSEHLRSNRQVLQLMSMAIKGFDGLPPLKRMFIGLDVAASELYNEEDGTYYLGTDGKKMFGKERVDFGKVIEYYQELLTDFPAIVSIEDGFAEEDFDGWRVAFKRLGDRALQITDDATVTQPHLVSKFVTMGVGGLLTKVNQGGTHTRTSIAMQIAANNNWVRILSHRSSEPADFAFETMMAIATGAEFLKATVGSTEGGGGGREARFNMLSQTNVYWESMFRALRKSDPDYDYANIFWAGVPEELRASLNLTGLPYQGLILNNRADAPAWLKRVQNIIRQRDAGNPDSYKYNEQPWYA